MNDQVQQGTGVIVATFVVAYILAIVPLPEWLMVARPAWVALVLLYWVIAIPHRIGVVTAWFVGLFLDVLLGNVLGQNAMALAVMTYVTYLLHLRIRVFPVWQQCLSIWVLVGLFQLIALLIQRSVTVMPWTMSYWLVSLVSAVIWPWLMVLLTMVRRRFRVG